MVVAANGVVIATEKKLPSILVDETSVSIVHRYHCNLYVLVVNILIMLDIV